MSIDSRLRRGAMVSMASASTRSVISAEVALEIEKRSIYETRRKQKNFVAARLLSPLLKLLALKYLLKRL